MAVFVTGGAGYIGSHIVYQLIKNTDEKIVILDNMSMGNWNAIHPLATFYHGDIRNRLLVESIFEKEDITSVIHLASKSIVSESVEKPLEYLDNNVRGTRILLDAMEEYGVRKMIFSSTAAVYKRTDDILTEDYPIEPNSPYGESKRMIEDMLAKEEDLDYVIFRYFNVAGARKDGMIGEDHSPETHLIPILLDVVEWYRPTFQLYGVDYPTHDGSCIRDFIHVEDIAEAHIKALDYLENGGASDVFNLGTGKGYSVREVIAMIEKIAEKKLRVEEAPRRKGDNPKLVADYEKAKRVLNWQPVNSDLEMIIKDAWRWYKRKRGIA